MATATETKKKTVDLKFPFELPKYLAIGLSDRQESSYRMEASGDNPQGTAIDHCDKILKRVSNIMVFDPEQDRWVVRQIRYLKGCPTIWVHEQEEMKYKSQNHSLNMVELRGGGLSFAVEGDNIQKAMFIMLHENNASFSEVKDKFKRPDGAQDVFFQIDTEVSAEKEVAKFVYEMEAKKYLARLVKKNKKNEITYSEDLLEFLSDLFKLPKFDSGYGAETFQALLTKANENPKAFLDKVGNDEAMVEADLQRALVAGVIAIDETAAILTKTSQPLLTFEDPRLNPEEKFDLLKEFLLNPKNRKVYDQVRSQTIADLKTGSGVIED